MKRYYNVHVIWGVMLALTGATYTTGLIDISGVDVVLWLLLASLIKGSFIIRDFMGLKGVSLLWKVIMYGWLWSICIVIAVTYIISL